MLNSDPRTAGGSGACDCYRAVQMAFERKRDEQKKALQYIESSIQAMDERMGDDSDWLRCKRLIRRSLAHLRYDWNLLPLMPYGEYLKTEHWEKCRKRALEKAKYRCQTCNAGDRELHTHHRTYDNLGNERDEDLIVLCEGCHSLFHERRELATTESR